MKKRLLSYILVGCILLSLTALTACGGSTSQNTQLSTTYNWKGGYVLSEDNPGSAGLIKFARLLKEKSDGQIILEPFFGGQLGTEKEMVESIQMGGIDIVVASTATLSNFTESQLVWDLPYLFSSRESARGVLDSEIGRARLDELSNVSIKGLTYFENGMYAIGSKEPIQSLSDVSGKKIRSHESNIQADSYIAFGGTSVVIAWGDVYTSLQNGTCDAISSTTVPNMFTAKFHEVAPYITMTEHVYSPVLLMMSQSMWDSLSEDIQAIVMEAAEEAKAFEREAVVTAEETCKKTMESEGAEFIDIDKTDWIAAAQKVYDTYVTNGGIDSDLVEQIKSEAAKY